MNAWTASRRQHVGRKLAQIAARVRRIGIAENPGRIKIQRPEDAELAASVAAIADEIESRAKTLTRCRIRNKHIARPVASANFKP